MTQALFVQLLHNTADYLNEKCAEIDELSVDINTQIAKLKEYRKIVIHNAVTGKIKVTESH